ncbi:MAG: hypothetical protein WCJ35_11615 [Planctomycetota bacterium]
MPHLNPDLYQALVAAFTDVSVSGENELRQVQTLPDWQDGGRLRSQVVASGEQYRTACPYCTDTRQRLYFSYQWAIPDPETGNDNLHLVKCFNENCVATRERQRALLKRVYPLGRERHAGLAPPSTVPLPVPFAPSLPDGIMVPLDQLPQAHQALTYLLARNFDPAAIWQDWQVQFCELSVSAQPNPSRRLLIPISDADARLAGWQARYVGACPDSVPKYLSCKGMKKSQVLYGLAEARSTPRQVVIVEGPTDVWRLGPGAVALFGKDMSRHQQQLLDRFLPDRPVIVFLDRDAQDKAAELQRTLLNRGRVAVLAGLPDGRDDVGDCTQEEAWQQIETALQRLQ